LARNGSGTYQRVMDWTNDRDAGVLISASRMDQEADDIATALSESIARDGQTTITANIPFANNKITGLGSGTASTDSANYGQVLNNSSRAGACRLTYTSATVLTLIRRDGDRLCINGANEQIPAAGVTLSNGGLSANTLYYVYAYMNSGTMTLEASTTGHADDTATGMKIKSGAATRTLVGMARTNASSQFVQTSTNLGVITYFNRRLKAIKAAFTADRTTTSTSYTELNSEIRLPFLTWGDNDVVFSVRGASSNDTNNTRHHTAVGIDTGGSVTVRGGTSCRQGPSTNAQEFNSAFSGFADESEGYHYATVMGKVGAGTGTWSGGTATAEIDITLTITVFG
jgi:hypothetical protein